MAGTDHDEWVRTLIAGAHDQPVPAYGSPEFQALPLDSPLRVAATVRAAEAWRREGDPEYLAMRLRVELDTARRLEAEAVEEQQQAQWDATRAAAARPGPSQKRLFLSREDYVNAARMADQEERIDRYAAEHPLPGQYPAVHGEGRAVGEAHEQHVAGVLQRMVGATVTSLRGRRQGRGR